MLGGVWDQDLLDQLYADSATYLHGHSVGGTNPSLLRAMGAGAAVLAFDVNFNREVLGEPGRYFAGPDDVAAAGRAPPRPTPPRRERARPARPRAGRALRLGRRRRRLRAAWPPARRPRGADLPPQRAPPRRPRGTGRRTRTHARPWQGAMTSSPDADHRTCP